jgi:hypothetical protein
MAIFPTERRAGADQPRSSDRRSGIERRVGDRRLVLLPVEGERRQEPDRRAGVERRLRGDRRLGPTRIAQETAAEHLRNALLLLGHVTDVGELDEETRRLLDAALLRVRFALDRVEQGDVLEG